MRLKVWAALAGPVVLCTISVLPTPLVSHATAAPVVQYSLPSGSSPESLITGSDGNVWIIGYAAIWRIDPGGNRTTFPVRVASGGSTLGPDGAVWFTQYGSAGAQIGRITPSGTVNLYPPATPSSYLGGITVGPDGNLWYADVANDLVGRIRPDGTGAVSFPVTKFGSPNGIAAGPDGNIWFAEVGKIGRIRPDGTGLTEFPLPTPTENNPPGPIVTGPDGNLWFRDESPTTGPSPKIGRITPTGEVAEFALPAGRRPGQNLVVKDGSIWFGDFDQGGVEAGIAQIDAMGAISDIPLPSNVSAQWLTVGPDHQIWFTDAADSLVGRLQEQVATPPLPTYYFAEGFTGAGFGERLKLFVPNASGTAQITYYTQSGPINSSALITAGLVTTVDVNQAVGDSQQVSAKVVLPGPGVAERLLNYQFGTWKGSEDNVGTTQPATEWDFAEGSTLPVFSEFLTLQNPNATSVGATINYYTDTGAHPTKGLNLPPNSRTTIEVFKGDPTTSGSCDPAAGTCGVGPGIQGVSAKVTTPSGSPIIVERPFYVNGYSFGSGPINDGHDAFGAAAPATSWNFAEGTTEPGFNEYLTLENPQAATANVTLTYQLSSGSPVTKVLQLAAQSRATVQVFTGSMSSGGCTPSNNDCGLSGIVEGVSVHIASDQAIVAERPMYMVHDFGSGVVSGATVVVGSSTLGTEFGFAHASTVAGENDYLTIQNPGGQAATLTITYYGAGGQTPKTVLVGANQRSTVKVFDSASGVGPSQSELGIVIISDQPVLVEKPTYSTSGTGGATDSIGYLGAF